MDSYIINKDNIIKRNQEIIRFTNLRKNTKHKCDIIEKQINDIRIKYKDIQKKIKSINSINFKNIIDELHMIKQSCCNIYTDIKNLKDIDIYFHSINKSSILYDEIKYKGPYRGRRTPTYTDAYDLLLRRLYLINCQTSSMLTISKYCSTQLQSLTKHKK